MNLSLGCSSVLRAAKPLVLAAALASCGSDPLAPFQPQVSNVADNFSL